MKPYLLFLSLIVPILSVAQKTIKVSYEQKFIYNDSFFNQIPEDSREEVKSFMTAPTYFELTNNGDFSLYESVNTKEKVVASKTESTPTNQNLGMILKPFKVWYLKDFKKEISTNSTWVSDKEYFVEAPFEQEELHYDSKTKIIDGYNCLSAYVLKSNKDTIQYWYTQDIAVIDGPKTPIDIPGLVLSIESNKKVVYATKIEFFNDKLPIATVPNTAIFISKKELDILQAKYLEPESYVDESGVKHESYSIQIRNDN
jgi:GLPGLI family protein